MSKLTKNFGSSSKNELPKENEGTNKVQAKQYDKIHTKNVYQESQNETAKTVPYLKAEAKLKHKTYAEENYSFKEIIIKVRNVYPYLSVFFGLAVALFAGWLFADGLPVVFFVLALVAMGSLSFAVIALLEVAKKKQAIAVFGHSRYKNVPALLVLFLFSVAVSGAGSYLMSFKMGDKSADITADFAHQTDSIRNQYLVQIQDYELIIEQNRKKLAKGGKWDKYHAGNAIEKAQNAKSELLAKIDSKSADLNNNEAAVLAASHDLNQYKAYILVLFIVLFEVLYLLSFVYEYSVERKIKTENQNHTIITPAESPTIAPNASPVLNFEQQLILGLLANGGNAQNFIQNSAPNFIQDIAQKNGIGFTFDNAKNNANNVDTATSKRHNGNSVINGNSVNTVKNKRHNAKSEKIGTCLHCGSKFTYLRSTKKYCSDECRESAWKERTGKTFKKSKKGQK